MDLDHPIVHESFAHIDRHIHQHLGGHGLTPAQYALAQRVIHSTADFDYLHLLRFDHNPIPTAITALQRQTPIIVDVQMVFQGVQGYVRKTFHNPLEAAITYGQTPSPGQTRTEAGLEHCIRHYPQAIYAIGNAPTALLALCRAIAQGLANPALIIGVPVGFINVLEAKAALAQCPVPQIRVDGFKGGSPVAAALLNGLMRLAMEETEKTV